MTYQDPKLIEVDETHVNLALSIADELDIDYTRPNPHQFYVVDDDEWNDFMSELEYNDVAIIN